MYKLSGTWQRGNDIKAVKFAHSGVLAAGRDGNLFLHSKSDSKLIHEAGQFLNSLAVVGDTAFVGAQDASIVSINLKTQEKAYFLGHTANVCALDAHGDLLVSGSWDKTARIWQSPTSFIELNGHSEAVWAVQIVDNTHVLTASADKTIILWQDGKKKRTFTGHTEPVRGLCLLGDDRFASCSNDTTIKIWSLDGSLLQTIEGHTSFVYALAFHKGHLFSTGEDRTLRIWRDTEPVQTIVLPGVSVWSVAVDSHGDVAVGSSDHNVRLFSTKCSRWLSDAELQAFEDEVSNTKVGEDQVQLDESQVKDASVLQSDGREGQVVMVRENGIVNAYQFSGKWQKIGEVMGNSQKKEYNGKSYDYVFDVDIADGVPPLKLPFNKGENVYASAEAFVERNELPVTYVNQVVNFLIANTQPPASAPAPGPGPAPAPASVPKTTEKVAPAVISSYKQPLVMTNFNGPLLAKAFTEKAADQGQEVNVLPLLEALPASSNELLKIAQAALSEWNPTNLLPVLDATRLAVVASDPPGMPVMISLLSCIDPAMPKYATLASRGFANIAARPDGLELVKKNQQLFTEALSLLGTAELTGQLALAAATLILNLSVIGTNVSLAEYTVQFTKAFDETPEATYRLALAIGVQAFKYPSDRPILSKTTNWLSAKREDRFGALAKEIFSLL